MKWLKEVLDRNAIVNIESPEGRALLAQAIIEALPKHVIATTIRESARAVLEMRFTQKGATADDAKLALPAARDTLASAPHLEATDPELQEVIAMSKCTIAFGEMRQELEGFARELGNNCAQSVLLMLEVEDDELDAGDVATRFDSTDSDAPAVP